VTAVSRPLEPATCRYTMLRNCWPQITFAISCLLATAAHKTDIRDWRTNPRQPAPRSRTTALAGSGWHPSAQTKMRAGQWFCRTMDPAAVRAPLTSLVCKFCQPAKLLPLMLVSDALYRSPSRWHQERCPAGVRQFDTSSTRYLEPRRTRKHLTAALGRTVLGSSAPKEGAANASTATVAKRIFVMTSTSFPRARYWGQRANRVTRRRFPSGALEFIIFLRVSRNHGSWKSEELAGPITVPPPSDRPHLRREDQPSVHS